jgi:hypothetical protein
MLQNVKKVLANPEPSTHDPTETSTCQRCRLLELKNLVMEWGLVLVHNVCLPARRRRANSGYRNQICAHFLKINSGVRDGAADHGVQFVGAQFAHRQSPDVPGRAHYSP